MASSDRKIIGPVDELTKFLAELDLHTQSLTIGLMMECRKSIEQDLPRSLTISRLEHNASTVDQSLLPYYVPDAHKWLLNHLHNPYPSNNFKVALSEKFGVTLRSLNIWFSNVRRRVGWTSISKRFFNGSRADTVDCAHRIFKRKVSDLLMDETISREFLLMKTKAENLYKGKLNEQMSSKTHGAPIGDVERGFQLEGSCFKQVLGSEHSRPNLADGLSVVNTIDGPEHPTIQRIGKRSRQASVSSEISDTSYPYESDLVEQSRKRFRTPSSSSQSSSSRSSTPMPSTPKDDSPSEFPFEVWQKGVEFGDFEREKFNEKLLNLPVKAPTPKPKKRRMSQSDELPLPSKRPRDMMALPRLHAVSDSYVSNRNHFNVEPCESHINLTLPAPATLNDLLPEDNEIEFFQNWSDLCPTSSLLNTKTIDLTNAQDSDSDAPALLSTTYSFSGDDKQDFIRPETSPVDLSSFVDLDKFLEALASDPSLMPPLLPDGLEDLPLFDSNLVTTSAGSELPSPQTALDIPLSTYSVEADSETVANLSCLDIPLISAPIPSSSTSLAEVNSAKDVDSLSNLNTSTVKDTVEIATARSSDKSSSSPDLNYSVSPIETKTSLEVSPVPESIPNNEDKDAAAAAADKEREDKLKRIQMLEAEMEKLKQEIAL